MQPHSFHPTAQTLSLTSHSLPPNSHYVRSLLPQTPAQHQRNTTPKPQNPLQVPWKFTLLNKTKLRENATNNPGRRCTCSKHGLSHAATLASGDSGRNSSNTMLSMYATRGRGESAAGARSLRSLSLRSTQHSALNQC